MSGSPDNHSRALRLVRASFPDRPALGTAVSHAILRRVAAGELPPTMRLHRPGPILAFGRMDRLAAGYADALAAAREAGFEPVERLAGGRAAVFHQGTLAFSRALPDRSPARGTQARFAEMAETLAGALRTVGVDARIGEVPGEYCPGAWSVNARGRAKLVGIGQRMIAGGAHVGGVLVVRDAARIRDVLVPVYRALGLEWEPATAGAVEDELDGQARSRPNFDDDPLLAEASAAILAELDRRGWEVAEAELDAETMALAERLAARHQPPE